ncbi:MAG: transcription elongation factor GreA [Anaerolineales bacterium]|nr:transcription elongation factor GreA [Anaerolineales bacterium]
MPTTFLTQQGFDQLQKELDFLRSEKRQEVADRLHEAMEGGELIENAEYEAAKNEQAFVEGRIQELEIMLATARIIEERNGGTIQVGSHVTIEDGSEKLDFIIVGAAEADPREGKISNESPIGKALLNHSAGDEVEVEAPDGAYTVTILKVK